VSSLRRSSPVRSAPARSTGANQIPNPHSPSDLGYQPLASFIDAKSGTRIEVHHPLERPDRWLAYLDGAESCYRTHDISRILGRPELEDGRTTSLFFVAVDGADRVVAGVRGHGPLQAVSDAQVLRELEGHARLEIVRDLLAARLASGIVEMKGAWVDPDFDRPGLSDALARCGIHAMNWFGARFFICSCATRTAPRWETTGGRRLEGLEPIAYPDARYQTVMLWWDRDRVARLADPDQWSRIVDESDQLARGGATHAATAVLASARPPDDRWQPEVLDRRVTVDEARLEELLADPTVEVRPGWTDQLDALRQVRPPVEAELLDESPRWVYYSWRRSLVQLLGPIGFRALRLDRNRNKITTEEQRALGRLSIGIVGLSVGHSIAYSLALEGTCGELRLADFDDVELSNLNRIPATVLDLGLNKAVALARRISELDPYLRLTVVSEGVTADNVGVFVDGLDVLVEECDSLDVKVMVREAARRSKVPVLMETSDRGLLDVERFDLEPNRPLFHGLLGNVQSSDLVGLSTRQKVPYILRILDAGQLSSRMAASLAEINETLTTWPQLGGDVSLGAATMAAAIRRLGRGEDLPSGRVRIDLEAALDALVQPDRVTLANLVPAVVPAPPGDPMLAVAHAANLAPSGGNAQPWSLQLETRSLRLLLDRTRTSTMDVRFRGSYIAIGAALLNARVAAAAHGILGPVDYFPEGEQSDLVAVVNFGHATDIDLAPQYARVLDRTTNRHPGRPATLDGEVVEELRRQVASEGARLRLLTGEDGLEEYADLLGESDRLRYLSPILHAEMMSELRFPGTDSLERGIDVRTLELDEADLGTLGVVGRADVMANLAAWDGGRALGRITRDRVRSSSALAVVIIPDSRTRSYVAGGAAVERMWLAAEAAGLAVQPVSPLSVFAVDSRDFAGLVPEPYVARLQGLASRLRVLAGLLDGEALALVLRLSHAAPASTRSLRVPLGPVLLGEAGRHPA
jgi:molybdopterin/thiamine biosynthesis adenylyltransferase